MGLVIRLCLYYGVTPVFIPIGEPWRNGVIESFNNSYDKKFYRRQFFPSYAALKRQSKNFQSFHNKHHRYSCLKGKTPSDVIQEANFNPITLPPASKLPKLDDVPDGEVILVRFIRSDRKLDVFSEHFKMPRDLIYSYVKAVILTKLHLIQLYQGDELVLTFEYAVPFG